MAVTTPTNQDVAAFIAAAEPPLRAQDGARLDSLFRQVTGWHPRMWGPSIIGYGAYDYTYASGHSGTYFATGFSPRKARHSIIFDTVISATLLTLYPRARASLHG